MPFEHLEEKEAVERAVFIEDNGYAFYMALAEKTGNADAAEVFKRLAADEKSHKKILEDRFFKEAGFPDYITDEELEIERFVRDEGVPDLFARNIDMERLVSLIDGDAKAVFIAIETEKHSVKYFEGLAAKAVSEEGKKFYLELAEEERGHVREIENLLG